MRRCLPLLAGMLIAMTSLADQGRYLEKDEFLEAAFPNSTPERSVIWVTEELRQTAESMLGHRFAFLRVRYWTDGTRTAWILDEVGKEEPITIGVSVEDGAVGIVRVLEFRESRGWEVRYPFFTDQFVGARMHRDRSIDRSIDGITGATMSVSAVSRIVQLALFLHDQAEDHDTLQTIRSASAS